MTRRRPIRLPLLVGLLGLIWGAGCQTSTAPDAEPMDLAPLPVVAQPRLATRVEFPMKLIGDLVVVETQGADGPWRFVIDTGASRTLVSPEFAIRYLRRPADPNPPIVWLRDANGKAVPVESVMLERIDFGPANFQNVRALVFDCGDLSDHLGVQIDGVLGFSMFANARLTLDYPGRRVVMSSLNDAQPLRGCVLPLTIQNDLPMVQLSLGTRSLMTLIDSGSDSALNLDPAGMDLRFRSRPRRGALVGTLHGDHRQILARLSESLHIGDHEVIEPIADLSGRLTSIGGGLLQHFEITIDQSSNQVAFYRPSDDMRLTTPPRLSSGLSFNKARAYWRINAVVPGSPAETAGFQIGDLVSRLNGEPVEQWDLNRYRELVQKGGPITYSLIKGRDEVDTIADVFGLVP